MTIIQLHTHKQTLFAQTDAVIAAGDRDTVRLVIETDREWTGYTLYAVLWRDGRSEQAVSVPLCTSGCCLIPALLLAAAGTLHIALAGRDSGGRIKTSTSVRYRILPGAPDSEGVILANVADATATPDQVLCGVTFYAGQDQILTGAIPTYEEGELLSDEVVDNLTVAADFSDGDQTVTAEGEALMRSVTVQMPATLIAENIARGVRIAGIEGSLPTLPEVSEEDNGKTLAVVDGAWAKITPAAATIPDIPFYDLAALGLPTVMTDGTTSDLTVDATAIRAALDKGAVKFALNVDGSGLVEVVMNKYEVNGLYICTYTAFNLTLTLMIAENAIQASAAEAASASIETYNGEVEVRGY